MRGSRAAIRILESGWPVHTAAPRVRRQARTHIRRVPRYVIVSVVCALLHNGIMIGLDRLGAHYVVGQTASAAVLLPIGYLLQGQLTFNVKQSWRGFIRYSSALISNFPVAIAVLSLLCDVLRMDMIWASPISMVVLFVWNYFTSTWAFSRRRKDAEDPGRG